MIFGCGCWALMLACVILALAIGLNPMLLIAILVLAIGGLLGILLGAP